jgi:hypothetical protein
MDRLKSLLTSKSITFIFFSFDPMSAFPFPTCRSKAMSRRFRPSGPVEPRDVAEVQAFFHVFHVLHQKEGLDNDCTGNCAHDVCMCDVTNLFRPPFVGRLQRAEKSHDLGPEIAWVVNTRRRGGFTLDIAEKLVGMGLMTEKDLVRYTDIGFVPVEDYRGCPVLINAVLDGDKKLDGVTIGTPTSHLVVFRVPKIYYQHDLWSVDSKDDIPTLVLNTAGLEAVERVQEVHAGISIDFLNLLDVIANSPAVPEEERIELVRIILRQAETTGGKLVPVLQLAETLPFAGSQFYDALVRFQCAQKSEAARAGAGEPAK